MKRLILTTFTLLLALLSAHAQECRTIAEFLNDKDAMAEPFTVKGVLTKLRDTTKITFLIEDETGEMNVRLLEEKDQVKKLAALDVRYGDTLTVSGLLSKYRPVQGKKKVLGMSQATLIATADAPGHDDEIPFSFSVDTKPLFLGDNPNAFSKWVTARLVYPEQSRLKGHEGTVIVHFVIFPDGTLHDIEVGKSSGDKLLDAEAIRVISLSPRWTPATLDHKPVKFSISAPVIFLLR